MHNWSENGSYDTHYAKTVYKILKLSRRNLLRKFLTDRQTYGWVDGQSACNIAPYLMSGGIIFAVFALGSCLYVSVKLLIGSGGSSFNVLFEDEYRYLLMRLTCLKSENFETIDES